MEPTLWFLMKAVLWFLIFVVSLVALVAAIIFQKVIYDLIVPGGCLVLAGLGGIAGSVALFRTGRGPAGGLGILIALIGLGLIWIGSGIVRSRW